MLFNPPPNWPPAPPGWAPPPGWQPDAAWPPLPPGWPLWVPDAPRRKTGLAIGALGVVLAVCIGSVVAIVAITRSSAIPGTPTFTAEALSDEDRVHNVVDRFEQAWNDADVDALRQLFCVDMRTDREFDEESLREVVETGGDLSLTIAELVINGDEATATILNDGEDPDDIGFVREDGDWKWCDF